MENNVLRPSGLFLVGDPKQSIYRFRGADLACYLKARDAIKRRWPENILKITENFRSRQGILDFVNERFAAPLCAAGLEYEIKRLNQAMRRRDPADKALDAAIGLEVLLGDKKDQGEITERLSRRGALLLGGDLAKRRETQQSIRHLYRFRSAVVHTGSAGGIPKHSTPEEVTENGIQIGLISVRNIVSLQALPPWEEWELLGRP